MLLFEDFLDIAETTELRFEKSGRYRAFLDGWMNRSSEIKFPFASLYRFSRDSCLIIKILKIQ